MINVDPQKRPKVDELLDFSWFDYIKIIMDPVPKHPTGKYGLGNKLPEI